MSYPASMPSPHIKISLEEKVRMLASYVPQAIAHMNEQLDGDLSADDIIDLFAVAAALVIDNDDHVKTPRDFRLAGETVGTLAAQRARELREAQELQGSSMLAAMLGQAPPPGPIN